MVKCFFSGYDDLHNLLFRNLHKIPNVDLIVGIPRSGVIIANMISELLNIPTMDLFAYQAGVSVKHVSSTSTTPEVECSNVKTILLVDDTVSSGRAMKSAKEMLKNKNVNIITFVPFALPQSVNKVDICLLACNDHVFPWNILKRSDVIRNAMVDIDGVICPDVPPADDDDGERYASFLRNDKRLAVLQTPIHAFVTARLEKYRQITETWLKEHNIAYDKLIMLNLPTANDRRKISVGQYKGNVYRNSSSNLFIEPSFAEAQEIFRISKKPVYCTQTGMLLQ